jgi:type I restriction enzyme M protein
VTSLGNFVWSIADQLRGVYKPHQYGGVILPMTVLRRLDCVLEPSRDLVREIATAEVREELRDVKIKRATGLSFYNTSPWDFARLVADPDGLQANLIDYIGGFSKNIDVFERFRFENEIAAMAEKNRARPTLVVPELASLSVK